MEWNFITYWNTRFYLFLNKVFTFFWSAFEKKNMKTNLALLTLYFCTLIWSQFVISFFFFKFSLRISITLLSFLSFYVYYQQFHFLMLLLVYWSTINFYLRSNEPPLDESNHYSLLFWNCGCNNENYFSSVCRSGNPVYIQYLKYSCYVISNL